MMSSMFCSYDKWCIEIGLFLQKRRHPVVNCALYHVPTILYGMFEASQDLGNYKICIPDKKKVMHMKCS
jgi:hypothetical protein